MTSRPRLKLDKVINFVFDKHTKKGLLWKTKQKQKTLQWKKNLLEVLIQLKP